MAFKFGLVLTNITFCFSASLCDNSVLFETEHLHHFPVRNSTGVEITDLLK